MRRFLAGLLAALFFLSATAAPAQQGPLLGVWKAAGAGGITPSSVFDIDLWTGTNLSNAITTPFAPDMVWIKSRSNATDHALFDTTRGAGNYLVSDSSAAQATDTTTLNAFNAGGYTLTTDVAALVNTTTRTYAGWAFKEAANFFDVVTWTGNATNRAIPHSLGVAPGMVIVKRTSGAADWEVWHLSGTQLNTYAANLNQTSAYANTGDQLWGNTGGVPDMNSSTFSIGTAPNVNQSGQSFVAYLFAQNPSGIVQCGTFTTDGSANATIALGWQPQWAIVKVSGNTGNWRIFDATRGWNNTTGDASIAPNLANAEGTGFNYGGPTGTGFTYTDPSFTSTAFIYCAIKA